MAINNVAGHEFSSLRLARGRALSLESVPAPGRKLPVFRDGCNARLSGEREPAGSAASASGRDQKSIRITARRGIGRPISAKPAAAKMLWLPTWSSPQAISCPGATIIG